MWKIYDIQYELGHLKIFQVCKVISLNFGLVRFELGFQDNNNNDAKHFGKSYEKIDDKRGR
jgi:hypothetical protein